MLHENKQNLLQQEVKVQAVIFSYFKLLLSPFDKE